jgi:hypothetical protein
LCISSVELKPIRDNKDQNTTSVATKTLKIMKEDKG